METEKTRFCGVGASSTEPCSRAWSAPTSKLDTLGVGAGHARDVNPELVHLPDLFPSLLLSCGPVTAGLPFFRPLDQLAVDADRAFAGLGKPLAIGAIGLHFPDIALILQL